MGWVFRFKRPWCCLQGGAEPHWGEHTTDESEGEVAHYNSRRREILDNAATVFADAAEDYGSLSALKARLESWKATHSGVAPIPQATCHITQSSFCRWIHGLGFLQLYVYCRLEWLD